MNQNTKMKEVTIFRWILIMFLTVSTQSLKAQTTTWKNLVPNYSFETIDLAGWLNSGLIDQTSTLADGRFDQGAGGFTNLSWYKKIIQYWSYSSNWTVPERRFPHCGTVLGIPTNDPVGTPDITYAPFTSDDGNNSSFPRDYSGSFWTLTANLEFAAVEPSSTIQDGHYYYIEVFAKTWPDGGGSAMGSVELYKNKPKVCGNNKYITEYGSNSDFQTVLSVDYPFTGADQYGWTRYRTFFQASGDKNWLSIGSNGPSDIDWDDIRIYEVSENLCRTQWYFDNTVFNYPTEVFQASDFIEVGEGVDIDIPSLHGPVTIRSNSEVTLRAGNYVEIGPDSINTSGNYTGTGIDMEQGAVLDIVIEPCKNLCAPVQLPNSLQYCISNSTQIGVPGLSGGYASATWSPSTYLDDPNSTNPTFTPPGTNGIITYSVFYVNDCPGEGDDSFGFSLVTVSYSDGSGTPPTVSYSNLSYDDYALYADIIVNDYVDEVVISYYSPQSGQIQYSLFRDIDFQGTTIPFSAFAPITVSCCEPTDINIVAKSYCGGEAATTIHWDKGGPIAMTNVPQVWYTPDDNDGIDDDYCFSSENACSYEIWIIPPSGSCGINQNNCHYQQGYITGPNTCLGWDGTNGWGNQMLDGHYTVLLKLYNDCGEVFEDHEAFWICRSGDCLGFGKSQEEGTVTQNSDKVFVNVQNDANALIFTTNSEQLFNVQIYNSSGQLVISDSFTWEYRKTLSAGMYIIVLTDESGETQSKKIIFN